MTIRTSPWPAGVPCWVDLSTPEVGAVQDFYTAVLGWTYAASADEFGGYVIAQIDGAAAAGIGPQPDGATSAWNLLFASDDADKTAAAVEEHGGTLLMPPGDVGDQGRMFMAADPSGAVFGGWQAKANIGVGVVNQPGGLVWEDLRSTDPNRARAFYAAVFGFTMTPLPMAGPEYATFSFAGEERTPLGGMGGMMGDDATGGPHWLVYFAVADAEASVAAAHAHGGTATPPKNTAFGRLSVITDPAGAVFAAIERAEGRDPDRADW